MPCSSSRSSGASSPRRSRSAATSRTSGRARSRPPGRRGSPRLWLALAVAAPAVLGFGRLLPAEGFGLALRLAGAAACVLLLPGAFLVRALAAPAPLGVALAGALAWSLV